MARIKVDYGIDLGTTNSAIARMEMGEPVIKKSMDLQKDTVPSCVLITKKCAIEVGDKALTQLGADKRLEFQNPHYTSNVFIEFKRTMGTDKVYKSSHLGKDLISEELSAEVLKKLKQPITDEVVNAVVVTVPAMFGANQKEATNKAAKLAGFEQVVLLSEPAAAAYAYGIKTKMKDGYWIVFDFGGGTFDAALLKIEEGIFRVISTEGDNYLGGKNIDFAIIDEILLPYFRESYILEGVFEDDSKLNKFRNQFKDKAEQAKIDLSTKSSVDLLSNLGENFGKDDAGNPFEFDLTVTRDELDKVQRPYFQRAIDITKELLKRNHLKGSQINTLILVGGPTLTPLLREMLKEQVTEHIDFSVDPMTVVAKGAALYASTIGRGIEDPPPTNCVELEINYDAITVETDTLINIKLKNIDSLKGVKIFAEIHRNDGGWSMSKIQLDSKAQLFELVLKEGKNHFVVKTTDSKGDYIECSPSEFTIRCVIEGSIGPVDVTILPFHYGIEIKNKKTDRMEFEPLKGLEKDRELTSKGLIGVSNGRTTSSQIRTGMKQDFLRIPIYQGNYNAKGSRAIYNEHVFDLEITGEDLPALLPEGSTFDLTIQLDRNESISGKAYFHILDYQHEFKVVKEHRVSIPAIYKIESEFRDGFRIIREIEKAKVLSDDSKLNELKKSLAELQDYFEKGKSDEDRRKEVFDKMREILIKVDELDKGTGWDRIEKEIREEFGRLEKANDDLGNDKTNEALEKLRTKTDEAIRSKDHDLGREVLEEIETLFVIITLIYQLIGRIRRWNEHFDFIKWKNPTRVRQLLNQGLLIIAENPTKERLLPICIECENNLPDQACTSCGRKISQCVCVS
ncbi:MAG: Hsp70 family protein [Sphingobacteriales bacterium]|nr:MAG: Hsp70 family protein [Sphingobacteriales bacterium]